ncbi:MAG: hypothetical protein ACXACX_17730 [Candidatus Hodarchaeales archaeon]
MKLETKHYIIILILISLLLLIPKTFFFPPMYNSEALGWYYSQAKLSVNNPLGYPLHTLQFGNIVPSFVFTPVLVVYFLEIFYLLGVDWITLAQIIPLFLVPLVAITIFYWFRKFGDDISGFFGTLFSLLIPITFLVLFNEVNYYIFAFIIFSLCGFLYMKFLETKKRLFLILCGIASGILIGTYAPAAIIIFIFYFSASFNFSWKNSSKKYLKKLRSLSFRFDKRIFINLIFILMIAVAVFLIMDGPFLFLSEMPKNTFLGSIATSQDYFKVFNIVPPDSLSTMFRFLFVSDLTFITNLSIFILLLLFACISIYYLRKNKMVQILIIFSILFIIFNFLVSPGDFAIDPSRTTIIQHIIPFNPTFIHALSRIIFYFISLPILAGLGVKMVFEKLNSRFGKILIIILISSIFILSLYNIVIDEGIVKKPEYSSLQEAYIWLKEQPDGMVISNYINSGIIFAVSDKKSISDTWVGLPGKIGWVEYKKTFFDIINFYLTVDLETANQTIKDYNITYILYYSHETHRGLVTVGTFNLSDSFNKIYDNNITKIYSTEVVDRIG